MYIFKIWVFWGLSVLFGFLHPARGQSKWKVADANIAFKIKNAGITVDGSFSGFEGELVFDPNNLAQSVLKGKIDVSTIDTGISLRDKDLKKEKYFNVMAYPQILLESQSLAKVNDTSYTGAFKLQMKGVTKTISIPFRVIPKGRNLVFKGNFLLDRREYGIGKNSLILADKVNIFIEIEAIP